MTDQVQKLISQIRARFPKLIEKGECMSESLRAKRPFWQKRFTVLGLTFLAFIICYLDRGQHFNCCSRHARRTGLVGNDERLCVQCVFLGLSGDAVFGGGYLANRFGGIKILGLAVIFWSIFTVITPWAAMVSLPALLAVRFLMGIGEAGLPPSSFTVIGRWFPHQERTRAFSLVSSGSIIGTIIALLFGSRIVENYGWESIFYIFGATGFVWGYPMVLVFKRTPRKPPDHIGGRNSTYQRRRRSNEKKPDTIPWKQIFSTGPLWALSATAFATSWVMYIFISWLPSYFAHVHDLDLTGCGILFTDALACHGNYAKCDRLDSGQNDRAR